MHDSSLRFVTENRREDLFSSRPSEKNSESFYFAYLFFELTLSSMFQPVRWWSIAPLNDCGECVLRLVEQQERGNEL